MSRGIEIFTDGSCLGNPGPGGYGVLLRSGTYEKLLSGGYFLTTNNRMELMAAIKGLEALKFLGQKVILTTDSEYLRRGITDWLPKWMIRGWRLKNGQRVKNQDLWQQLYPLVVEHRIRWNWVKGHSGHRENDLCDRLANQAAQTPLVVDTGYMKLDPATQGGHQPLIGP